jgi:hypothetical protein
MKPRIRAGSCTACSRERVSDEGVVTDYAELAVTTNFSFLRGASHAEELVTRAKALGLAGIGIADRNTSARGSPSRTARRTFLLTRATAPPGAGSAACSASASGAPKRATAFSFSPIFWRTPKDSTSS